MAADAAEGAPPRLTLDGPRAAITLARPAHHNRLHREDLHTLQRHIATVAALPALRVLVLTGQGPTFSSGFHLGEMAEHDGAASADLREGLAAARDKRGPRFTGQ
jgi:enoyl-CoA hydratase/carnithine racemase